MLTAVHMLHHGAVARLGGCSHMLEGCSPMLENQSRMLGPGRHTLGRGSQAFYCYENGMW